MGAREEYNKIREIFHRDLLFRTTRAIEIHIASKCNLRCFRITQIHVDYPAISTCIAFGDRAAILLKKGLTEIERQALIAHELGHLVMHFNPKVNEAEHVYTGEQEENAWNFAELVLCKHKKPLEEYLYSELEVKSVIKKLRNGVD